MDSDFDDVVLIMIFLEEKNEEKTCFSRLYFSRALCTTHKVLTDGT